MEKEKDIDLSGTTIRFPKNSERLVQSSVAAADWCYCDSNSSCMVGDCITGCVSGSCITLCGGVGCMNWSCSPSWMIG